MVDVTRQRSPWPDLPSATKDSSTTLRPMTIADQAFCRTLFHEDRRAQFAPLGLGENLLSALLDHQWHAQQIGYRQMYPDAAYLIVEHDSAATGRVVVELTHGRSGSTVRLIDIVIRQAARGRAIGSRVIGCIATMAYAQGVGRIVLTVLPSNERALHLYARLGFVATHAETHITMIKPLP
jgi:GNAT superfamily N-acetyltransferase